MSAPKSSENGISIVAASLIGYQTAEPLILSMLRRGMTVWLFAPSHTHSLVCRRIPKLEPYTRSYESLKHHQRLLLWVHKALTLGVTPHNYSAIYNYRYVRPLSEHRSFWFRFGSQMLTRILPEVPVEEVNKWIRGVVGRWVRSPFPTNRVVVVTRSTVPHVFCGNGCSVISVMESWDHAPKSPTGYVSDLVFVWSSALANDWVKYQGDRDVRVGYPGKLGYAIDAGSPDVKELRWNHRRLLYPASYSSFSDPSFFRDELAIIDEICKATLAAGLSLVIKPKPNGPKGEFANFASRYPNVELEDEKGVSHPNDYFLDEEYNEKRLALLRRCDAVLNLGTTFGLDAAAFGLPVIQMRINCPTTYPGVTKNFDFDHFRHICGDDRDVLDINENLPLSTALESVVNLSCGEQALHLSRQLRVWLGVQSGLRSNAVERMVDAISTVAATQSNDMACR